MLLMVCFATIGLNARLAEFLTGGRPFAALLLVTFFVRLMQNPIDVCGAVMFFLPVQAGGLFGSAPLVSGYCCGIAWAEEVAIVGGTENTLELGAPIVTLMRVVQWLDLLVALGCAVHRYCVAAGITRCSLCPV